MTEWSVSADDMSSKDVGSRETAELLADALQNDIRTADHLTAILTRTVPWEFPGKLLEIIATATGKVSNERVTHAVVAVNYGCLHQYLHAIPRVEETLVSPAATSVYAKDTTAAILDGDLLQSCAFTHLTEAGCKAETIERWYGHFAAGSIHCYEQIFDSSAREIDPRPIAGVAARIGAELGGGDQTEAAKIEEAGLECGRATPVRTPTGWNPPATTDTSHAIETLGAIFDQSVSSQIESLLYEQQSLFQPES